MTELPKRSRQECLDALVYVAYERVALDAALAAYSRGEGRPFTLEAALIHARNLTEFFWPRGRNLHDAAVYAAHYLPPKGWPIQRLPQSPDKAYREINAQLAHVSTKRSRSEGAGSGQSPITILYHYRCACRLPAWRPRERRGGCW